MKKKQTQLAVRNDALLRDIRVLIQSTRERVAESLNAALTTLYWQIGRRIHQDILDQRRAEYGKQIVSALGRELELEFGKGFSEKSLRHMIRFAEVFPDEHIVSALRRQLSWTHIKAILYIDDPLKREFYAGMCRVERWNTRTLQRKIDGMLFERTALSKKPAKLAAQELKKLREEDKLTPDLVFRDPYLLDFLGLKDTYAEKDLEAAILREMEAFLLELGVGFTFVERQKRITVDGEDFFLDLLFYHRHLKRLVAVDLKLGDFKPADKGQMELYLRWLARYERATGEKTPIGLILCAGKREEAIELLDLAKSGIRVSEYWTEALPRKVLEQKLHDAVRIARAQLAQRKTEDMESDQSKK